MMSGWVPCSTMGCLCVPCRVFCMTCLWVQVSFVCAHACVWTWFWERGYVGRGRWEVRKGV